MAQAHSPTIDHAGWFEFLPHSPVLTSFQSGWPGIQLAHYYQPPTDLPEISNAQHVITIPLGHQAVDLEIIAEGRSQMISYREKDYQYGYIELVPANLPYGIISHSAVQGMEFLQCYLEPELVAQVAHESIDPDSIELLLTLKTSDVLIYQIGLALRSSLQDGDSSHFYAESMATALSAHLLRCYSTRNHSFREHEDGLSKQKLEQAIDYIQAHLGEDLSLNAIAKELGMSQYYFCHLFKQSTGLSPHQYLIRQRVERAKILLKQSNQTVTTIALECGFASSSHFARCFRQLIGLNPNQFRKLFQSSCRSRS